MTVSHFNTDFRDFLIALSRNAVKYLIVGGEAVIYYGYPRLTGDIDIFYKLSNENSDGLYAALSEFWDESIPGIKSKDDLMEEKVIIQFGAPPNRIDLINYINGVSFDEAWRSRLVEKIKFNNKFHEINYIGLDALIKNKEALKRNKDMEDLKYLKSVKK